MRWSYNPSTRHFRAQTDSDFFVSEWSGAQAVRFVASTGESVPMRSTYTRTAPPVRHRYLSIYLSCPPGLLRVVRWKCHPVGPPHQSQAAHVQDSASARASAWPLPAPPRRASTSSSRSSPRGRPKRRAWCALLRCRRPRQAVLTPAWRLAAGRGPSAWRDPTAAPSAATHAAATGLALPL